MAEEATDDLLFLLARASHEDGVGRVGETQVSVVRALRDEKQPTQQN